MKRLVVDIGNTSAHFAFDSGRAFGGHFSIATAELKKKAPRILRAKLKRLPYEAVIASVVPEAGAYLKQLLLKKFGVRAYLAGRDLPIPVKNRYRNPKQVGIDRLLNALAGWRKYRRELVIIDFGTAITFDVVSKKGEYLGGIIAPGIEISLDALFSRTALLPRIKLSHPHNLIGRDTVESIRSGCSYGIGGLCDRIVEEVRRRSKMRPLVLATGGYAKFMSKYCRSIDRIEPDLILQGLRLTYRQKS